MDTILTLIATGEPLAKDTLHTVQTMLSDLGANPAQPAWLARDKAIDLALSGLSCAQIESAVRPLLGAHPIDMVVQPSVNRRKKLLLADMDSTMVTGETLDELADFAGIKDEIAAVTARAMNGEIDFAEALRLRVARLKGLSVDCFDAVLEKIALTGGAQSLVATMRGNGAYAVLISGGLRFFTSRVGQSLGFHVDFGNTIEVADGKLTGRVLDPIVDHSCKYQTLIDTTAQRGLSLDETIAVGDGANDLKMIETAGLGVAFHAKPMVAARARTRIDHADLTALLFAQGYRADEFLGS